jgi:hypothetical protein
MGPVRRVLGPVGPGQWLVNGSRQPAPKYCGNDMTKTEAWQIVHAAAPQYQISTAFNDAIRVLTREDGKRLDDLMIAAGNTRLSTQVKLFRQFV